MRDNDHIVAGATRERAAVTSLGLDVAHNGTLGHLAQWQDIADRQRGLAAGIQELHRQATQLHTGQHAPHLLAWYQQVNLGLLRSCSMSAAPTYTAGGMHTTADELA